MAGPSWSAAVRQLRVLLWKNAKLRLRHPLVFVFELAVPVGVMLLLALLHGVVPATTTAEAYPSAAYRTDFGTYVSYVNNYVRNPGPTASSPEASRVSCG